MFGRVWRWAGQYSRESNRRLGIDYWLIQPELRQLLSDVGYWLDHETFPPDELAVRFHHGLTRIHPFPNGNGRFARLAADMLVEKVRQPAFTWGQSSLVEAGDTRRRYVDALRTADKNDFGPLLEFVRT